MTNLHYYRVELFYTVIDMQMQELNARFTESNTELLLYVACLSPSNSFSSFGKKKMVRLAELYPKEFSSVELLVLHDQLDTYIVDMRSSNDFSRLNRISDLAQKMVETGRNKVYPLVYLLLTLALILPIATATVEKKEVSHRILKRCEGLPLAIVAVSGVLAAKDWSRIDEWEMVHRSLGAELDGNDKLESMKQSVFPEDHQIERMKLLRFWIAKGFVNATQEKTLEEVAKGYLSDIVNRNLVQVAGMSDGRLRSCHIHELMHEIILSRAKEQNIATIVCGGDTRCPEKVRRLSIHRDTESVADYSQHFSRLHSLIVLGTEDSVTISSLGGLCRGGSTLLKLLDLRGTPLETLPDEIFTLIHLKYLSLSTTTEMVPKLIRKLENFKTLDLKGTYITKLPEETLRLRKLRHLLLYHYEYGGLYLNLVLNNLHSVNVASLEEDEILDLQSLFSAPPLLQRLYLKGRLEKLPHWITSHHSHFKVYLNWSKLRVHPLQCLQDLPNLVELQILQEAYEGEGLCFKAGGFQRLKALGLQILNGLRWVKMEEGVMPRLERLHIRDCELLEEVPSVLFHSAAAGKACPRIIPDMAEEAMDEPWKLSWASETPYQSDSSSLVPSS
ncbi:disease resistance protein RPM1-like [Actinidia eriantha]|uniref:disease resistance protein RPM1-like n=1 Tax=Actinidia eriantha TaxID=165200 RepID=UPI0025850DF9|nr:disease resistance protein RPM1-like [Actinidia eriantha]